MQAPWRRGRLIGSGGGGNGAGRALAIGRPLTRRAAALWLSPLASQPRVWVVCSTPTYLRSCLRLRVEAHAGLLAGTRSVYLSLGVGLGERGGAAGSRAGGWYAPDPPLCCPSTSSFPFISLKGGDFALLWIWIPSLSGVTANLEQFWLNRTSRDSKHGNGSSVKLRGQVSSPCKRKALYLFYCVNRKFLLSGEHFFLLLFCQ